MIFRDVDFIKGMSQEAVDAVVGIGQVEKFKKGETVFNQGDAADEVFVLESGTLELIVGGTGRTTYVADKPGEVVGWSAVVGRNTYSATGVCTDPTSLIKIDRSRLEQVLKKHPESGLIFYRNLARAIGERLLSCYQMLV